jgi:hypothetical protein
LSVQTGTFAVVRLPPDQVVPDWLPVEGFSSTTRTPGELSVVCPSAAVPPDLGAPVEDGWVRLELEGPFEFHLTGILAAVLVPLAEAGVGIFALSTYDTDHVLVKDHQLDAAVEALRGAGHAVST